MSFIQYSSLFLKIIAVKFRVDIKLHEYEVKQGIERWTANSQLFDNLEARYCQSVLKIIIVLQHYYYVHVSITNLQISLSDSIKTIIHVQCWK